MKLRLISQLKKSGIIFAVGILYYFVTATFGIALPCLFKMQTGLLCPACGVTRMMEAVINFDFMRAYGYNKVLFLTLPIALIIFLAEEIKYIVSGKRELCFFSKLLLWTEIVGLVLFGIIRNII